jgi:hypothetical protein
MAPIGEVEDDSDDDNIWVYFPSNTNDSKPPSSTPPKLPKVLTPGTPSKAPGLPSDTVANLWKDIVSKIDAKPPVPDGKVRLPVIPKGKGDKGNDDGVAPPNPALSIKYYETNKVEFNASPTGSDADPNEFEDLVIQEIGGRELLILERHDMVDGINQTYEPVKNLSKYALEYSPTNIDPYPNSVVDFFEGIIFELNDYIPTQEELEAIGETALVRFDETLNSIIINVKDLLNNQFVEVEFVSFDEVVSDTIEV